MCTWWSAKVEVWGPGGCKRRQSRRAAGHTIVASESQSTDDGHQRLCDAHRCLVDPIKRKATQRRERRKAKAKRPEKLVVSGAFFRIQWPKTGELPAARRFLISSTRCQQVSSRLLPLVAAVVTGKREMSGKNPPKRTDERRTFGKSGRL